MPHLFLLPCDSGGGVEQAKRVETEGAFLVVAVGPLRRDYARHLPRFAKRLAREEK